MVGLGLVSPWSTSATCIPTIIRCYAETTTDVVLGPRLAYDHGMHMSQVVLSENFTVIK